MQSLKYILALSIVVFLAQACTLNEAEKTGDPCYGDEEHPLNYIVDVDCGLHKCYRNSGKFSFNFQVNRCPVGYTCGKTDDEYYCKDCGDGQILCDDHCVNPDDKNNLDFCGARGLCSDSDPDSKNFRGIACGKGTTCERHGNGYACLCNNIPCDGICNNGVCEKLNCAPNVCARGECKNADDRCGADCMNCGRNATCNVETGECECSTGKCGARGLCNESAKDSENYEGVDCGDNATCNEDGICECHTGLCGARGRCSSSDSESENYQGVDCLRLEMVCDEATKECKECDADTETYVDGKCVNKEALHCGTSDIDCTKEIEHWGNSGLFCDQGHCKVKECEKNVSGGALGKIQNYHPDKKGESCEPDTDEKCGNSIMNCKTSYHDPNAETVGCRNGRCVSLSCKIVKYVDSNSYNKAVYLGEVMVPSYTFNEQGDGACIAPLDYSHCGLHGTQCEGGILCGRKNPSCAEYCLNEKDYTLKYCELGYQCLCPLGKHYDSGYKNCIDDDDRNCGEKDHDCTSTNDDHLVSATCVEGKCKYKCQNGYEWCANKCVRVNENYYSNCVTATHNMCGTNSTEPGGGDDY